MSDRNKPESRWSSVRDREEREKRRAAAREEARRAREARDAGTDAASGGADSGKRRLTDDERRTIQEYRFPSTSDREAPQPASPAEPSATASSLRRTPPPASTKWRDSVAPVPGADLPGLPDLPGEGGSGGRKRPGNGRVLIFGGALFALMALIAFLPFGPFGGEDRRELPTPSATLPTILGTEPSDGPDDDPAEPDDQPVAGEDQAVVCIDPGHGGWDTGWNRTDLGENPYGPPIVTEAELNLGMSYMLKAELEEMGMFVVLTRPSGAAVNLFEEDINGDGESRREAEDTERAGNRDELQERINVCNEADADILISMHINGVDDPAADGYEVIYTAEREFGDRNEELANLVYRQLDQAMRNASAPGRPRGAQPDTNVVTNEQHDFGSADHFIMTGPAVEEASITPSEMPGIIVEAAFLSNDADAVWIVQPDNQRIVIEAYAQGIRDYFDEHPPGS